MSVSAAALEDPRKRVRPTLLGWVLLAEGLLLVSSRWWPGELLPTAVPVTLGLALLVALVAGWWWAPRRLEAVEARWRLPETVPANEEVAIGAVVTVREGCPPLELHALDPMHRRIIQAVRLKALGATQVRPSWTARFPIRGLVRLPPIELRCQQPFGTFEARRPGDGPGELVVLPPLGSLRREFHARLSAWLSASASASEPGEDEVAHLRAYRPGDAPRQMHWRASARARRLLVTERHDLVCRHVAVVLDCGGGGPVRRFEQLVSAAATTVDGLCAAGWTVSVHGPFAGDGMHGDRLRLLSCLALAQPCDAPVQAFLPHASATLIFSLDPIPADPSGALVFDLAACEKLMRLPRNLPSRRVAS